MSFQKAMVCSHGGIHSILGKYAPLYHTVGASYCPLVLFLQVFDPCWVVLRWLKMATSFVSPLGIHHSATLMTNFQSHCHLCGLLLLPGGWSVDLLSWQNSLGVVAQVHHHLWLAWCHSRWWHYILLWQAVNSAMRMLQGYRFTIVSVLYVSTFATFIS